MAKLEQESHTPAGADEHEREDTRESDPIVAEAMGYAMKPGVEDAQRLDAMKDEAVAQYKEAQGFEQSALGDKVDDLDRASLSSRDAAEEAAKRARRQETNSG